MIKFEYIKGYNKCSTFKATILRDTLHPSCMCSPLNDCQNSLTDNCNHMEPHCFILSVILKERCANDVGFLRQGKPCIYMLYMPSYY